MHKDKEKILKQRICEILTGLSKPETKISDIITDLMILVYECEREALKESRDIMLKTIEDMKA